MDEIGRLGRDNWGWQARIGMFIVGNEAVPEAEMWAMAPPLCLADPRRSGDGVLTLGALGHGPNHGQPRRRFDPRLPAVRASLSAVVVGHGF